jgi:hypothetical protein
MGDFNNDGIPDLATADAGAGTITVLLGTGTGAFNPSLTNPVVTVADPVSLAVGDFNGDGNQDLAVVTVSNNSVEVFLGNGLGGFSQLGQPIVVGITPLSVVVGDFNGDGIQDLAVANDGSNNVTVLLGDGTGHFTQPAGSPIAVGTNPHALTIGDFNGDGRQDLAVANFSSSNVTLLFGDGSGDFATKGSPITVGANPLDIKAGYFNNDSFEDLVTANAGSNSVTVLLGTGLGGFTPAAGDPFAVGTNPIAIAIADFNGDGVEDIAVVNTSNNDVTVLIGDGSGAFAALNGSPFAVGLQPLTVAAGDFNLDGREDLATANSGGNNLTILLGLLVGNSIQTIAFAPLSNVTYGVSPITIGATSSSSLAVSFASITSAVCTVAGNTVTTLAVGACSIVASQEGNVTYAAAATVTQTFNINAAQQTITFGALNNVSLGVLPFPIVATASSGLPVSLASGTSSVCTISAATVTIVGGGTCSITASQAGNAVYQAAVPVVQSFMVAAYQLTATVSPFNSGTITIAPASPGNYYAPDATVCLTATPAAGQIFTGWTGTVTLNASGCFTITGNASVVANFETNPVSSSNALRFIPSTPCRLVDTRNATGPLGGPSIGAGASRSFIIPGTCGIPSTALAYSLNLTVVPQGTLGYITLWPTGQSQPVVSTLNSIDGRIKSNAAIVPAGTSGALSVYATNTTNVILDINGYFDSYTDPASLQFYPLTPCRVADTRSPAGALGAPSLLGGQMRIFPIMSSACNIPGTASAYSLNFTAIPPAPLGYLTVWPDGESQPVVSTLNAPTGAITANAAIVPAGTAGAIELFVTDPTDMAIDINGYFAPAGTGGLSLYNLAPCRIEDSRQPSGAPPITGTITVSATGAACGVPSTAQALVLNATAVPSGGLGYLTLWANGGMQPVVSTLNSLDGSITSNMAVVPTTNGSVNAYAAGPGETYLILDISGYFAP